MKNNFSSVSNLLLIIDRKLPHVTDDKHNEFFNKNSLYLIEDNILIPINVRTFNNCISLERTNMPEVIKQDILKRTNKKEREYIKNTILTINTQLNVNILINSPGGAVAPLHSILSILKYIREKGGEINSFSFIEVMSAASIIFSHSDKRYCLKLSEFMVHSGSINLSTKEFRKAAADRTDYEIELGKQMDIDDHKKYLTDFFAKHNSTSKKTIDILIAKAIEKPECDLYMSGYNLESWGIVDKAYHDFDKYLALIEKKIGKEVLKDKRIKLFLKKMDKNYFPVLLKNLFKMQKYPGFACPQ